MKLPLWFAVFGNGHHPDAIPRIAEALKKHKKVICKLNGEPIIVTNEDGVIKIEHIKKYKYVF